MDQGILADASGYDTILADASGYNTAVNNPGWHEPVYATSTSAATLPKSPWLSGSPRQAATALRHTASFTLTNDVPR